MNASLVRTLIFSWLLTTCLVSSLYGDSIYRTKSLAPGHRLAIQRAIATCRKSVQAARDPDTRSKALEELCKKLIQAEEFDEALNVAQEVANCQGADPERRAVHHFLIAQIYAMRMEASPTLELMEENRQLALRTAREVMAKRYPKSWLISESAAQLIQSLNDPKHLREVRGWVEKRQNDPGYEAKLLLARTQSVQLEHTMPGKGGNLPKESYTSNRLAASQGTAVVRYSRASETDVAQKKSVPVAAQTTPQIKQWRGPIVVEGNKIHSLEQVARPVAQPSPYAPGAEPVIGSVSPSAWTSPATR